MNRGFRLQTEQMKPRVFEFHGVLWDIAIINGMLCFPVTWEVITKIPPLLALSSESPMELSRAFSSRQHTFQGHLHHVTVTFQDPGAVSPTCETETDVTSLLPFEGQKESCVTFLPHTCCHPTIVPQIPITCCLGFLCRHTSKVQMVPRKSQEADAEQRI